MQQINWSKWSAIAEIVSSIAILTTLVYLSIQTEQNTAAIEASVRQAVLAADQIQIYQFIDHPVLNKRTGLTEDEKVQVSAHITALLRTRESHWLQYVNGVLDEGTWRSYRDALIPVVFSSAYGRSVWAAYLSKGIYDPDFARYINEWVSGLNIAEQDSVLPTPNFSE